MPPQASNHQKVATLNPNFGPLVAPFSLVSAMVTPDMFTFDHLKEIEDAGMFSGVVLIKSVKAESLMGEKGDRNRHAPSAGFSSDAKCPNAPSSGYKVYPLTPLLTRGQIERERTISPFADNAYFLNCPS